MLSELPFPLSLEEVPAWATRHQMAPELALRRFAYFAAIHCLGTDEHLAEILIMRGASAWWLFYNGLRISPDLDFFIVSVNREAPADFLGEISDIRKDGPGRESAI